MVERRKSAGAKSGRITSDGSHIEEVAKKQIGTVNVRPNTLLMAMEFGFRQCETGLNLEGARKVFAKIMENGPRNPNSLCVEDVQTYLEGVLKSYVEDQPVSKEDWAGFLQADSIYEDLFMTEEERKANRKHNKWLDRKLSAE